MSDSTTTNPQTPMQEIAERVGEVSPMMALPRMSQIVHENRQRKNYRRQLEQDRATQTAALRGENPPEWSKHDERDEEDGMGDSFSIAGDTTNHNYPPAESVTAPPPMSSITDKKASMLPTAALIAAGLLGAGGIGAAVPWLAGAYDRPATNTTIETPGDDRGLEIEVIPGGWNSVNGQL